jgi:hypothetical protein
LLNSRGGKSSKFFPFSCRSKKGRLCLFSPGEDLLMKTSIRGHLLFAAALGMGLLAASGCQTWVPAAGMTLPSGRYLKHPPQYIPPDEDFPLTNEEASMEEAAAPGPGGGVAP